MKPMLDGGKPIHTKGSQNRKTPENDSVQGSRPAAQRLSCVEE